MPEDSEKLLEIYLQDHFAGASGGAQLAKRIAGALESPEKAEMGKLAEEIEEDREALRQIMVSLDVDPDRIKQAAAQAGELMGRLKLNGRVLSPSPLSRVIEYEGMIMGVTGKLQLWRSLSQLTELDSRLDAAQLRLLIERAEDQRRRLEELHATAARFAFEPAATPAS
jgi:hypothetical protein